MSVILFRVLESYNHKVESTIKDRSATVSDPTSPALSMTLLRTKVRGVSLTHVYLRLQRIGAHSAIQGHGQTGRASGIPLLNIRSKQRAASVGPPIPRYSLLVGKAALGAINIRADG